MSSLPSDPLASVMDAIERAAKECGLDEASMKIVKATPLFQDQINAFQMMLMSVVTDDVSKKEKIAGIIKQLQNLPVHDVKPEKFLAAMKLGTVIPAPKPLMPDVARQSAVDREPDPQLKEMHRLLKTHTRQIIPPQPSLEKERELLFIEWSRLVSTFEKKAPLYYLNTALALLQELRVANASADKSCAPAERVQLTTALARAQANVERRIEELDTLCKSVGGKLRPDKTGKAWIVKGIHEGPRQVCYAIVDAAKKPDVSLKKLDEMQKLIDILNPTAPGEFTAAEIEIDSARNILEKGKPSPGRAPEKPQMEPKPVSTSALPVATAIPTGVGLPNPKDRGVNACYVNSTIQALRNTPAFRLALEQATQAMKIAPHDAREIERQLFDPYTLCAKMTPKRGASKEEIEKLEKMEKPVRALLFSHIATLIQKIEKNEAVTLEDVNRIRNLAIALGFHAQTKTSQEDAAELCTLLLDKMGIPHTTFKAKIDHGVTGVMRSLTPPPLKEPFLSLELGSSKAGTELSDLVTKLEYFEEIDLAQLTIPVGQSEVVVPGCRLGKTVGKLTRTELEAIQGRTAEIDVEIAKRKGVKGKEREIENFQVEQARYRPGVAVRRSLSIEGKPPQFLPVSLKRFGYSHLEGKPFKKQVAITPTPDLYVSCEGQKQGAHYRLASIVVHQGISASGGHYYSYVPKVVDGKVVWVKFDDDKVTTHNDPAKHNSAEYQDVLKNAYIFNYELVPEDASKQPEAVGAGVGAGAVAAAMAQPMSRPLSAEEQVVQDMQTIWHEVQKAYTLPDIELSSNFDDTAVGYRRILNACIAHLKTHPKDIALLDSAIWRLHRNEAFANEKLRRRESNKTVEEGILLWQAAVKAAS